MVLELLPVENFCILFTVIYILEIFVKYAKTLKLVFNVPNFSAIKGVFSALFEDSTIPQLKIL